MKNKTLEIGFKHNSYSSAMDVKGNTLCPLLIWELGKGKVLVSIQKTLQWIIAEIHVNAIV